MFNRKGQEDDYLNLRSPKSVDEFALGDSSSSDEQEHKASIPNFVYIVPIVAGFVILVALGLSIFVMRAWDQTPILDNQSQSVRVIEPNTPSVVGKEKSIKSTENNKETIINPTPSANPIVSSTPKIDTTTSNESNKSVSAILPTTLPAVGMVLVKAGNRINSGSGFVVRSSGLFVTNHHVIDGAQEIAVKLNNNDKVIYADLIKTDPQKDIALLQLRDAVSYPVLQLEENFAPNLGDDVIVLGYPLGIKLGLEITVSTGIISSTRALPEVNLIQTNAAINHGNSGGPMISRRSGKVIGIVTAKARDSESIGFAINVNELKQILENTR